MTMALNDCSPWMPFALAELSGLEPLVVTMAPPGSSRPSLTYTDQTLEALLPAITPCLNFGFRPKAEPPDRYSMRTSKPCP
jgi:hypothetical protein